MLNTKYSRVAFESSDTAKALADELAAELTIRLAAASDPGSEVEAMVAELKVQGHDICSWDASDEFETWGDSWLDPRKPTRLVVEFAFQEGEPRSVIVHYGPWPA